MPKKNRLHVIVNPHGAYGKAKKRWPEILKKFEDLGFDVVWRFTQKRFHASHITQEMIQDGAKMIVGVGGDGTMNEIINGILHSAVSPKNRPELVLIPIGTGADLAKTLGIPEDGLAAIDLIKHGRTRLIDIGEINLKSGTKKWRRYFANVFDAGLGGNVDRIANAIPKGVGGFFTFLFSSLIAITTFKPMQLKVWLDDKLVDQGRMTIIGAANGEYFGGDMHIAPMALTDDGIFEILYVKDTNIFKFLWHVLAKVYQAEHLKYRNVHHYRATRMKISSDKSYLMDIDGEIEKAQEVLVSLIPKAIKIRVPETINTAL